MNPYARKEPGTGTINFPTNPFIMTINSLIISMLKKKAGYDVTTPAGATRLSLDIETATGQRLGLTTIKRITGIIPYDNTPRASTLDILARYLGFNSWDALAEELNRQISGFGGESPFIDLANQPVGTELSLSWEPDRRIRIRHEGEGFYLVKEAANSKLLPADRLTLSQIAWNFPLVVKEVEREGKKLGCYRAAPTTGITQIIFH